MTVAMIRPLQRPVPLRQSVYDALIDLIVGGELPPGQHMVETDLARQLGVSRQPISEALHRMEAEGWVDLRPSQGAFVHVPTGSEVDELLDVRALLEAETARLAAAGGGSQAPQARQAQLARLREICREGQAAAEANDFGGAVAANNAFHAEIAVMGGNAVLAELAGIGGRRGPRPARRTGTGPAAALARTRLHQPERAQQVLLGRSRLGRRDQLVQAPAGLVEQAGGLLEQRDPLRNRHGPYHEVPNDLGH